MAGESNYTQIFSLLIRDSFSSLLWLLLNLFLMRCGLSRSERGEKKLQLTLRRKGVRKRRGGQGREIGSGGRERGWGWQPGGLGVCRAKGLRTLLTLWSLLLGFQNVGKVFAIPMSVWVRPPATPHSTEGWGAMCLLSSGAFITLHT